MVGGVDDFHSLAAFEDFLIFLQLRLHHCFETIRAEIPFLGPGRRIGMKTQRIGRRVPQALFANSESAFRAGFDRFRGLAESA